MTTTLCTDCVESLTSDDLRCPACGDIIDFCQGHGEIGDPRGAAILAAHDAGDHSECSVCPERVATYFGGVPVLTDLSEDYHFGRYCDVHGFSLGGNRYDCEIEVIA